MKIALNTMLYISVILACLTGPAMAGMVGNASPGYTPGQITSVVTGVYYTPSPTNVPTADISLPIIPQFVLLIGGFVIIIAAMSGLLWRYFHPKYVAPDEKD
jgi:hypothetical protein